MLNSPLVSTGKEVGSYRRKGVAGRAVAAERTRRRVWKLKKRIEETRGKK